MDSFINALFDRQFMVTMLVALAVFATVLTLAAPLMAGDKLNARLKSVALRREELRRLQREALSKKGQLRSSPTAFMKNTVEKLNLRNLLESANTKEKLSRVLPLQASSDRPTGPSTAEDEVLARDLASKIEAEMPPKLLAS